MDPKEIRMRCIEAVSNMGIRAPNRITQDAIQLEAWVTAAPEKEQSPVRGRPKKDADKS